MSEQNNTNAQKKIKPNFEEKMKEILSVETQKSATDFVAYLRNNKMTLSWAGFKNAWKANCKGETICYVKLHNYENDGSYENKKSLWVIYPCLNHINEYEDTIINEGLQDIIWDNVFKCINCRTPCNDQDKTILGKVCKNLCGTRQPIWFFDPNEETISCIERLLNLEQTARSKKI
ncbi:MAG: hypothetical protein LBI03_03185 [Clostridiales bacterium]|jgi:hypothetical protein|nr:hypothetical protein [Clostridiales bacterium]